MPALLTMSVSGARALGHLVHEGGALGGSGAVAEEHEGEGVVGLQQEAGDGRAVRAWRGRWFWLLGGWLPPGGCVVVRNVVGKLYDTGPIGVHDVDVHVAVAI